MSGFSSPARRRRATAIVLDIEVLLTFDAGAITVIEQRHRLGDGRIRHVLAERPTALAASIGLLDQATWLDHARTVLPPTAVDEWLAYHGETNQPVLDLLRRARMAGRRILLTATGTQRLRDDLAHHELGDIADHVYLSAETGYGKPDPAAWLHILRHSNSDPDRVITIEPRAPWAHAGRQLGLRAHHYTDPGRLHQALRRTGALR